MARLRASRTRFTTGPGERGTELVFWSARPGVVRFTVRQVAPSCRTVGTFSVRADRGRNRVRFTGRLGGEFLAPGTYTVTANRLGRRAGRAKTLTLVVADSNESLAAAAPSPSVCGRDTATSSRAEALLGRLANDTPPSSSGASQARAASPAGAEALSAESHERASTRHKQPAELEGRGAIREFVTDPFDAPLWVEILLFGALALGLLLAAAAVVAGLRAREGVQVVHRTDLAVAAGTILVCVAVTALLI